MPKPFTSDEIDDLSRIKTDNPNKFMQKLFFDVLELDTDTAYELAEQVPVAEIIRVRQALNRFKQTKNKCQDLLKRIARKSPKG